MVWTTKMLDWGSDAKPEHLKPLCQRPKRLQASSEVPLRDQIFIIFMLHEAHSSQPLMNSEKMIECQALGQGLLFDGASSLFDGASTLNNP